MRFIFNRDPIFQAGSQPFTPHSHHECGQILSAGDLILFMVVFMQTINQNQQADYAGNGGADCCRFVAEKNLAKGGKVRKTLPAKC